MTNEKAYKKLEEAINSERKMAAFLGAGTSFLLGIKGWDALLEEMNRKFNARIDVANSILTNGYGATATLIYKKSNSQKKYLNFLNQHCQATNTQSYNIHEIILDLFSIILTTNFDLAIKTCVERRESAAIYNRTTTKRFIELFPSGNSSNGTQENIISYLHGRIDKGNIIFRQEEYEANYVYSFNKGAPTILEQYLMSIFQTCNLLFLGFSFEDKAIKEFVERISQQIKSEKKEKISIGHEFTIERGQIFVVISKSSLNPDKRKYFKDLDINVIEIIDGQFIEFERFLTTLMARLAAIKNPKLEPAGVP